MSLVVSGSLPPPPYEPECQTPPNGSYLDASKGIFFTWTYRPAVAASPQTAYAFERRLSGTTTTQWWTGTAWSTTQVYIPSSADSLAIPAGAWGNGQTWQWSVSTQNAQGASPYSLPFSFEAQAAPTLTVTTPSTATARPTISWRAVIASGASLASYRVMVYTTAAAQIGGFVPGSSAPVFDTGPVAAAAASSVEMPPLVFLASGTAYRAYVLVVATGGQTSGWEYAGFMPDYSVPSSPTVSARVTVNPTTDVPAVRVRVTNPDPSAYTGTSWTAVQWSANGATWFTLRGATHLPCGPSSPDVTVMDNEAPPGYARHYRAWVIATAAGNNQVASLPAAVVTTAPDPGQWWLRDPLVPAASMRIRLLPGAFGTVSTTRQQVVNIIGSAAPIVLSDVFSAPVLSLTLVFGTNAEYLAFENLRASQHVLLLQGPYPAGQWYVRFGATKKDTTNLASLRGWASGSGVVRQVQITAQTVATP